VTAVAGILLTGGRSRRIGTDKATLVFEGESLAARSARRLAQVCDPVLEMGDGRSALRSVREQPPGSGPRAALAAAGTELRAQGHPGAALVLAVDLPRVDVPLLRLLCDWSGAPTVVPTVEGRPQPVCARYGSDALLAAVSLVAAGIRSLHELLDVVEHDLIGEEIWVAAAGTDAFSDIDTRADAERFGIDLPG
jgi:molybdopterin-guanine dinucleotide biosynthesis protein A